jgi:WD40 repeat protein
MKLYVLTPNTLTIYQFVLGEGWTDDALQTVEHDLQLGTLAVDESGSRVAVAGTTNDGVAAVRVIEDLFSDQGQVTRTILEYNATGDIALLSPSFNADGSVVAVFSTDNSVLLLHPETGATESLETGTEEGVIGAVAFSRDGLLLWVYNGIHVEAYAVAAEAPSAG